ncbi:MAG: hemerythrin domain-containing protein [Planctomycetota bacterium]|nr:hemerythrin domain-containing protein [Planctomycetota bacterium]
MVLKPSEIRTIILEEHGELRRRLAGIEALLEGLSRGDSAARRELRTSFDTLCHLFITHIAHEEAILRPILADIDNWGPIRIELMDREHVEQRQRVAELAALSAETNPGAYVRSVREFVTDLRADMDGEERECLSPDVLRDDTTSIDAFGG